MASALTVCPSGVRTACHGSTLASDSFCGAVAAAAADADAEAVAGGCGWLAVASRAKASMPAHPAACMACMAVSSGSVPSPVEHGAALSSAEKEIDAARSGSAPRLRLEPRSVMMPARLRLEPRLPVIPPRLRLEPRLLVIPPRLRLEPQFPRLWLEPCSLVMPARLRLEAWSVPRPRLELLRACMT